MSSRVLMRSAPDQMAVRRLLANDGIVSTASLIVSVLSGGGDAVKYRCGW